MNKLKKFFQMSSQEKNRVFCRKLFGPFQKKHYGHLGKNSYIWKPMLVCNRKHIYIGDNCSVYPDARIECICEWMDQSFNPQLQIGNNCFFGQQLHMTCAESIIIEDNVTISARVLITDINHSYQEYGIHSSLQKLETSPVKIGENTLIGMNVAIMPGVQIGKNVVVGANSVVTKNIPDGTIVAGNPAKPIKRYDSDSKQWVRAQ